MLMMAIEDMEISTFLPVHNMVLIDSPDGTHVYGSRGGEIEGMRSVLGLKAEKLCSERALPIHLFRDFCCRTYHLATMCCVTDRWTDR